MPPQTPQAIHRHCETIHSNRFVALTAPCLSAPDACAFALQHRDHRALQLSWAWQAGDERQENSGSGNPLHFDAVLRAALANNTVDQAIVLVQHWPTPTDGSEQAAPPSAVHPHASPAIVRQIVETMPGTPPHLLDLPRLYGQVIQHCLSQAPRYNLDQVFQLTCQVHYDDATALERIMQEFSATALMQRFNAEGVSCAIQLPGIHRARFLAALRSEAIHPEAVTLTPGSPAGHHAVDPATGTGYPADNAD